MLSQQTHGPDKSPSPAPDAAGDDDGILLELKDVVTFYGAIQILKDVNIQVRAGEVVSLLGGNASGKTTTMKTILGLVKPAAGTVTFRGRVVNDMNSSDIIARGLAPVPEARRLFATMSVRENLMMGAYATRHRPEKDIQDTYEEVLEIFPRVRERLDQPGGTLSGGEQQMVAVARALMAKPKLILMDEPSMGLAPALVETVFDVIAQIKDRGTAMFIVEQNANMALSVADRGYVLQNGKIVVDDTAENLLASDSIRKAYLGQA